MPLASAVFVWAGGLGHLVVTPAPGQHVNAEAPAALTVNGVTVEGAGDLGGWRAPVAGAVEVSAEVPVCADDGSQCTVLRLTGRAAAARRGSVALVEASAPVASATGGGGAVAVYDFAAVWCPPCNLLAAEVLETPAAAEALAGRPITRVDVDSVGSWALKSQYHVGGYPTLVAVDAAGGEVARLLGYPGRDATLAWLAGLGTLRPLTERMATADPVAAAALARELADAGDDAGARALLARAAPDAADTVIARLTLDGAAADARWLFDHHVPGGDWVYAALDADPTLVARVPDLVPGAPGEAAGGWLGAAADQAVDPSVARALRAGALASLEAARAGDLALDRGRLSDLAQLRAALGGVAQAYALMDEAAARWPAEFTWPFVKGRIALDGNDLPTADAAARLALAHAEGDQVLRAAMLLARVQRAAGHPTDGVATLDAALAAIPEPPATMQVRTTRYRAEAQKLRAEIATVPR